jgi:hypothetical protein
VEVVASGEADVVDCGGTVEGVVGWVSPGSRFTFRSPYQHHRREGLLDLVLGDLVRLYYCEDVSIFFLIELSLPEGTLGASPPRRHHVPQGGLSAVGKLGLLNLLGIEKFVGPVFFFGVGSQGSQHFGVAHTGNGLRGSEGEDDQVFFMVFRPIAIYGRFI